MLTGINLSIYLFLINEFQKRPIVYGSKVALVHVSTGKYLSTKGVRYKDFHKQIMVFSIFICIVIFFLHYYFSRRAYIINFIYGIAKVICNGQEIDLENDVWTVIGANGASISAGGSVFVNTIVGFRYQETGNNLHSHDIYGGRYVTPISKQQQGNFEFICYMRIFYI